MVPPPLRIVTVEEQHELVLGYLQDRAHAHPISILEAGCGQKRRFDLQDAPYTLTGVDLDKVALDARQKKYEDLHEAIVGDLCTVVLKSDAYDVIYSSYVLEHIKNARHVMNRFVIWLKPNGLLVLYIPDCDTTYGFIAKHTPHWLHVFFYRHILGLPTAGTAGHAPYRTCYDSIVSRSGIRKFANDNQLTVLEECGYYKPGGVASILMDLVHYLSFGRLSSSHCDLLFILEKRGSSDSTEPLLE